MNRDKSVMQRLSELVKAIFDLKSKQFSGTGNTMSYLAQTGDTWDINETATTTGMSWYGRHGTLNVTFTADNQPAAFTTFEVTALINNQPYYLYTGNDGSVFTSMVGQQTGSISVAKYQEYITFNWGCNTGVNVKIKVRAISVAKGTMTVTKTINGA